LKRSIQKLLTIPDQIQPLSFFNPTRATHGLTSAIKSQSQIQHNARLLFDNRDHRGDLLENVLRHARKLERGLIENCGGSIFVIKSCDIRTRVVFVDLAYASRRQSTDNHAVIPINMRSDLSAVHDVADTGGETRIDRAIGSEVSFYSTVQAHRSIEGSQIDYRKDDRNGGLSRY
jgi:hypothetical protein